MSRHTAELDEEDVWELNPKAITDPEPDAVDLRDVAHSSLSTIGPLKALALGALSVGSLAIACYRNQHWPSHLSMSKLQQSSSYTSTVPPDALIYPGALPATLRNITAPQRARDRAVPMIMPLTPVPTLADVGSAIDIPELQPIEFPEVETTQRPRPSPPTGVTVQ